MSRQTDVPSLTDAGRKLAVELADCYVEVDIERNVTTEDECREFGVDNGRELLATWLGRDIYLVAPELLTANRECVLKIPSRLMGSYENRWEATYWRRCTTRGSSGFSCHWPNRTSPARKSSGYGRR